MSSSLKDLQCIAVCKADGSSVIQTSTTHPLSGHVAESPILIRQRTNHAGRLLLLTGAPGCPTGSTTGLLQWDSLQRSLVHGSGRLATAPLKNTDQAKPHPTHPRKLRKRQKTNSGSKTHHRKRRETKEEKLKRGPWGAKILQALVTLESKALSLPKVQHQTTN